MFQNRIILLSLALISFSFSLTANLSIRWDQLELVSKSIPTFQVVSNPLLKRDTLTHDSAYSVQKQMQANYVRFVPWYWFGDKYAVVETKPPSNGKTYWDFSSIDPLLIDFMAAQEGRPVVMNFSTIPKWITDSLSRPSGYKLLADYYSRLVSWYTKGGFTDELGAFHASGHHFKFDFWEVFNEPDLEGKLSAQEYCRRYDSVVVAIRKVDSTIKFAGPGLAYKDYPFLEYVLNPVNHLPGIPMDMITYHNYLEGDYFKSVEAVIPMIYAHNYLRDRFRPKAITAFNEMGTFGGPAQGYSATDPYWVKSGAVWAFQYGQMCLAGKATKGLRDLAGMSQLMAQPGNFPEVSMCDWRTGKALARARILELITHSIGPDDSIVTASSSDTAVFVLGFITASGAHKALVVNKSNQKITVAFSQAITSIQYVDVTTNQDPVKTLSGPIGMQQEMNEYAVWIATFDSPPVTFSPPPGNYVLSGAGPIAITLKAGKAGQAIYYTTDGSTPTLSSKVYSSPIPILAPLTLKALLAGSSEVITGTYSNSSAQLFNKSFEIPAGSAGSLKYRPTGTGWDFLTHAGISSNNSPLTSSNPPAPEGSQALFLQMYGRAQQWITMNAGTYKISLKAAQRGNYQNGGQNFAILVDGIVLTTIIPPSTSYSAYESPTFTVPVGQHLIELRGLDTLSIAADNSVLIDDINLTAVSYTPTKLVLKDASSKSLFASLSLKPDLEIVSNVKGELLASLVSSKGNIVASWARQVKSGDRLTLCLPPNLAKGIYLINFSCNNLRFSKSMHL